MPTDAQLRALAKGRATRAQKRKLKAQHEHEDAVKHLTSLSAQIAIAETKYDGALARALRTNVEADWDRADGAMNVITSLSAQRRRLRERLQL